MFQECPIATPVLNKALPAIRQNVKDNFSKYKKGATLLLRDSFVEPEQSADQTKDDQDHLCITDYKAEVCEKIEGKVFKFPAGSFFQNNNSVLPVCSINIDIPKTYRDSVPGQLRQRLATCRRPISTVFGGCILRIRPVHHHAG